jgi:hypothetical protein
MGNISTVYFGTNVVFSISKGFPFDSDAQAFINATGITNTTTIFAINTLVGSLKNYGIWNKMEVIYPFVGGTATTNKYNLVDPQDTNGAYRINFQGTWTHNSTGSLATTDATYGNTYFNPSVFSSVSTGMSWGYYEITGPSPAYTDKYNFGAFAASNQFFSIEERINEADFKYVDNNSNFRVTFSNVGGNRQGFRQFSSSGSATGDCSLSNSNGTTTDTGAVLGTYPNLNLYVGNLNLNNSTYANDRNYLAFAYMGTPLTAQERTDYFTAVQAFQTTLGRQV